VAQKVFGVERLRGRVDRIIRESELHGARLQIEHALERLAASQADTSRTDEEIPTMEDLTAQYVRRLQARLDDPRLGLRRRIAFLRPTRTTTRDKRRLEEANRLTRE
jgi:hypothetical protein